METMVAADVAVSSRDGGIPAVAEERPPKGGDKAGAGSGDSPGDFKPLPPPLNAYNLFFRHERARLLALSKSGRPANELEPPVGLTADDVRDVLEKNPYQPARGGKRRKHRKTHGVVSFTELNRIVSRNWKALDKIAKEPFYEVAKEVKLKHYHDEERRRQMHELEKSSKTDGGGGGDGDGRQEPTPATKKRKLECGGHLAGDRGGLAEGEVPFGAPQILEPSSSSSACSDVSDEKLRAILLGDASLTASALDEILPTIRSSTSPSSLQLQHSAAAPVAPAASVSPSHSAPFFPGGHLQNLAPASRHHGQQQHPDGASYLLGDHHQEAYSHPADHSNVWSAPSAAAPVASISPSHSAATFFPGGHQPNLAPFSRHHGRQQQRPDGAFSHPGDHRHQEARSYSADRLPDGPHRSVAPPTPPEAAADGRLVEQGFWTAPVDRIARQQERHRQARRMSAPAAAAAAAAASADVEPTRFRAKLPRRSSWSTTYGPLDEEEIGFMGELDWSKM